MGILSRTISAKCSSADAYYTDGDLVYFNNSVSAGTKQTGVNLTSASFNISNYKQWDVNVYFQFYLNGTYVGASTWSEPDGTSNKRSLSGAINFSGVSQEAKNLWLTADISDLYIRIAYGNVRTCYFYRNDSGISITANASYTDCSAPSTVKLNNTDGDIHVASGSTVTLSWSGASAGQNNPIAGYEVFRNGTSVGTTTEASMIVSCPSAGSSYTYTVKTKGTRGDSGVSSGRTVYAYSAPSAPTNVTINNSVVDAGTAATLSWSGGKAGSGNSITGYKIYRATSANGTYTYILWATGTSATVYAPDTMGASYFYKIVTAGQYSDSSLSGNYTQLTARTYTAVNAPTNVVCTPNVVSAGGTVTLSWSGASGGTNTSVASYQVHRSTSSGSGYSLLTTTTGTSVSVTAPPSDGSTYYYKIIAVANKSGYNSGLSSAFGYVTVPVRPNQPVIKGTTSGKSYNIRPRVLATIPEATVVGAIQSISASGWTATRSNLEEGQKVVLRKDTAYPSGGTDNVSFTTSDNYGQSNSKTVAIIHQVPSWTDDPVVAGTTPLKASHVNELRQAIDDIRAWYGMTAYTWSETITAGVTSSVNWASHMIEIKNQIEEIKNFVNSWDNTNSVGDITLPVISTFYAPKADVVNKLREAITLL